MSDLRKESNKNAPFAALIGNITLSLGFASAPDAEDPAAG